jgi:hypothetical protein
VLHDVRDEKFKGLHVAPSVGIDRQIDAGVLVLPDQVNGLGYRTDKAAQRPVGSQRSRFVASAAVSRESSPG